MSEIAKGAWVLPCDGGARGNPGPGAYGYVLYDASGAEVEAQGGYLGHVTNNVAEYRGLIAGLEAAAQHAPPALEVRMDSELVIRQMTGAYRVKNAGLKPLYALAQQAAVRIRSVRYTSVAREENGRADQLVNDTLDEVLGSESPR